MTSELWSVRWKGGDLMSLIICYVRLSATSTQVCVARYELLVNCSEHHLCDSWQNMSLVTTLPEGQGIRWKCPCLRTVTIVAAGKQQRAATHWTTKAVQRAFGMYGLPVRVTDVSLSLSRQKAALVIISRNGSLVWTAEATLGHGRFHSNEKVEILLHEYFKM
jgi:hypothetical protein